MNLELSERLLNEHRKHNHASNPQKLVFKGFDDYDIYNPSAVFNVDDKNMIVARVEKRDSEISKAVFFYEQDGIFIQDPKLDVYDLQDPFITKINGYFVFGGTSVKFLDDGRAKWYTKMMYGKSLDKLTLLVDGPKNMKDVRLVELKNHEIGIFSRPQGEKGGRGKIGFTKVKDFNEITADVIYDAPLLNLFSADEWGGANDAIALDDTYLYVLGHIANFDALGNRHYYAMTFHLNMHTLEVSHLQMVAERKDFLEGPTKREDLVDVIFAGGIVQKEDKKILYVGTSDCEVQSIEISD
jgi:hypothetical protein